MTRLPTQIECVNAWLSHSNSNSLNFSHADRHRPGIVIGMARNTHIEASRFCVAVSGHTLCNLNAAAIGEIVRYASCAELWHPIAVSIPALAARRRTMRQTSPRCIGLSESLPVLSIADRDSGSL